MARLALACLGPFQVTLDGQPVTEFKSNKVRALLAYLAVEADRPHRREVLAGLLWPDWPDRQALGNLRFALSDLRRAIGDHSAVPPFLLVARDTLQFNCASDHRLDAAVFTDLAGREDLPSLEGAVSLYRGAFLEGFSVADSVSFEDWALLTRERLARQMSAALHRLAAACEQRAQYDRAESLARRQLELEPWDEAAHQQLMRALALSGQRSAALAQYEVCRRLLADELRAEPARETTVLAERIRGGELRAVAPRPVRVTEAAPKPPPFLERAETAAVEMPVFVAREQELGRLDAHLRSAQAGQGRVVFVTGEAGSGKTALIQAFIRHAQASHPDLVAAGGQGNAHTGVGDPYLPFREILGLLSGDVEAPCAAGAMTREQALRLWRLLPSAIADLIQNGPDLIDLFVPATALLQRARSVEPWPLEPAYLSQMETRAAQKAYAPGMPLAQQGTLFEQYTQVLRALAARAPLLLTLDDLQWADAGSLHLLFHLGRRLAGSRILLVGAYRQAEVALGQPGYQPPGEIAQPQPDARRERHPLESIVNEFKRTFGDVEVSLEQAEGRPFVRAFLDSEPNRLDPAFHQALYERTQGLPLFTVELLRGMQERGDLVRDSTGRWVEGGVLDWETLPARVEAVVAERIGRLPPSLRNLLSVASVEGEAFTAEVVARVQVVGERETLQCLSDTLDRQHRLVSAQGIRRLGGQRLSLYRFRHILFQQYLYGTLDPVERSYLHEQVGMLLEQLHQDEGAADVAVQLARHFEQAGITEKAIRYLHQAGERAVQLSAYQAAITHLTRGLALLMTCPDSPARARAELDLRLALGIASIGAGSFSPDGETAYARALELGRQTGETAKLCQALAEMAVFHYVRAEHRRARAVAEEALRQARQTGNPMLVAWIHWSLGFVLFGLGEFALAREHLEQAVTFHASEPGLYSVPQLPGADSGLSAMSYLACCLWCLGYPEQALRQSQRALALAHELEHALTLGDVLCYGGCVFNAMRRDARSLTDCADQLRRVAEREPTWRTPAVWHRGEAAVLSGELEPGIAELRAGLESHLAAGKRCDAPRVLAALAQALAAAGQPEEARTALAQALSQVEVTDERYWEAELHRLTAELLLVQGDEPAAEASLLKAVQVARRQSARSLELRATTRLARLWQAQGRRDQARQALAQIYGWFTEGFDTPDLSEARKLLEEL